jgi:hypothetical protein
MTMRLDYFTRTFSVKNSQVRHLNALGAAWALAFIKDFARPGMGSFRDILLYET